MDPDMIDFNVNYLFQESKRYVVLRQYASSISFVSFSDLSRNKLTELPQECTEYYSLERLVLYHNTIRSIPDSVVNLHALQFLDLR